MFIFFFLFPLSIFKRISQCVYTLPIFVDFLDFLPFFIIIMPSVSHLIMFMQAGRQAGLFIIPDRLWTQ